MQFHYHYITFILQHSSYIFFSIRLGKVYELEAGGNVTPFLEHTIVHMMLTKLFLQLSKSTAATSILLKVTIRTDIIEIILSLVSQMNQFTISSCTIISFRSVFDVCNSLICMRSEQLKRSYPSIMYNYRKNKYLKFSFLLFLYTYCVFEKPEPFSESVNSTYSIIFFQSLFRQIIEGVYKYFKRI